MGAKLMSSRKTIRGLRRDTRRLQSSLQQSLECPFTLDELRRALHQLKPRKAAGPDGIAPEMLKKLLPAALPILFQHLNTSWITQWYPQFWRSAEIISFHKKGKNFQLIGSNRPIALTSTISKTMEKIIVNRMSKWLKDNGTLSPWRAGFLKGNCTADQCLRLSQVFMDEFQSKQRLRSVAAFFDFSKAYDQVWRANLLQKMLNIGAPLRFVE